MSCRNTQRESFLIRIWTEAGDDQPVMRGLIENVQTGHRTYFQDMDLPLELLKDTATRLTEPAEHRAPLR
jgi:hypothetical protein